MIEDVVRKGRLLDIYGPLLTDKQRRCMEMYFNMDLSLSEIGEELAISRQGAYDMLNRASKALEGYEARLRLLAKREAAREQIDKALLLLQKGTDTDIKQARQVLENIDL